MITELNIDNETVLNLEMDIEGSPSSGDAPVLKFCIDLGAFTMVVCGTKTTDNVYEIKFPKMKGIAPVGTYDATVDVFIGDKRFEAMSDKVEIKQDVKPVVKQAIKKDKEPTVSVKTAVVVPSKEKESAKETAAEVVNTPAKEKESVKENVSPLRTFIEKTDRTVLI